MWIECSCIMVSYAIIEVIKMVSQKWDVSFLMFALLFSNLLHLETIY